MVDYLNFQIWEVEPYSRSGNYPAGHGLAQVELYLKLLNTDSENIWMPGRYLRPLNFSSGIDDVYAWWEAPGLIVYQTRVNQNRLAATTAIICLSTLAQLWEMWQKYSKPIKPGDLGPWPEPNPYPPPVPGIPIPPGPIPVPIPIP